jgi:Zn-dependent oligopeptidase
MAGRRVSVGAKLKIGDVDGQVKDLTTSLGDKKIPIDTNLKIDDADTKIANITGSLTDKYVDVNIRPSEQSIKNFVANLQTELNKLNTENTPVASEQTVIDQDKIQSEVKQSEENFRSLR